VWGALKANPVYVARYRHLTSREQNKLTPTQAQTVIGAAILRQLHAVITTGRAWDPDIAVHGTHPVGRRPSPPDTRLVVAASSGRSGRALRGIETPRDLAGHHGQPRPSSPQPDYTLMGPSPITAMQGQTTDEAPTKPLT
jgi:hypothetical protein